MNFIKINLNKIHLNLSKINKLFFIWQQKTDRGIYETLIRRGNLITAKYKVSKYLFFSLSGYTTGLDILLITIYTIN